MTWKGHRATTLAIVYAATGFAPGAILAMCASTLPDRMEFGGLIKHRTVTHWPVLALVMSAFVWYWHKNYPTIWSLVSVFVVAGYTAHLLEDLLSISGLPFFSPRERPVGLGLYKTGTTTELLSVIALVAISSWISWQRGFLDMDRVISQFISLQNWTLF